MNPIHHIELYVSNLARAARFYAPLLLALGFSQQSGKTYVKNGLLICLQKAKIKGRSQRGTPGLHHLAFSVLSRREVDEMFRRVIRKLPSVTIEDRPAACPEYGYADYYATYFFDPDGTKLEVVYAIPTNEKRYRLKR